MQTSTAYFTFDEARQKFGDSVDRYQQFLYETDPLADNTVAALAELPAGRGAKFLKTALDEGIEAVPQAPEALKALFAQVDRVPFWVDWDRMNRGSIVFQRVTVLILTILAFYSLPMTYTSPAGSKPLVSTNQLVDRAARRLTETIAFVMLTCQPGGLKRFGEGFKINLKVRLMHAQVRRSLLRSGRWDAQAWAMPINQAHMAGTLCAISAGVILKLQELGFEFTTEQIDDFLQLWRYSGVDEELICTTLTDARRLSEMILAVEGTPDEDCKALVNALREVPLSIEGLENLPWLGDIFDSLFRSLLGDRIADALEMPQSNWPSIVPALRPLLSAASWVQLSVPGGGELVEQLNKQVLELMKGIAFKPEGATSRREY